MYVRLRNASPSVLVTIKLQLWHCSEDRYFAMMPVAVYNITGAVTLSRRSLSQWVHSVQIVSNIFLRVSSNAEFGFLLEEQ